MPGYPVTSNSSGELRECSQPVLKLRRITGIFNDDDELARGDSSRSSPVPLGTPIDAKPAYVPDDRRH